MFSRPPDTVLQIFPFYKLRKLRPGGVKRPSQSHSACKGRGQDPIAGCPSGCGVCGQRHEAMLLVAPLSPPDSLLASQGRHARLSRLMLHGHVAPAPSLAAPRLCSQGLAQWVVLLSDNFVHPFTVSHEHFYWLVSAVPTLYHERADTLTQQAWDCSPQRGLFASLARGCCLGPGARFPAPGCQRGPPCPSHANTAAHADDRFLLGPGGSVHARQQVPVRPAH